MANLKNLQDLYLSSNQITDITPLANLKNLKQLSLSSNQVTDITPLANLNNLQNAGAVVITRLPRNGAPLANLNRPAMAAWLHDNQIAEVGPLAGLYNLERLYLKNNQIEDISALVANTSLGEGDVVHLTGNPLSDKARNEQIPALQARGVDVTY